ncbi:MAG: hypothetical protein PHI79_02065 [Sulfurovaceae bacterium]|nr:hypothetical protein [Sulfurovaceae bacterium]MDD5548361.1 hypothetical protein [Sulfurovaceae bacterium]
MKSTRKAIAMIELIFAIVVMGIAMLAIPMITSQTIKGSESALMQESVSAAASELNMILAKPWDSNGTDESLGSPILRTNSLVFDSRAGLDGNNSRTRFYFGIRADASNNVYDPDENDIGDFNGKVETLTVYNSETTNATQGDYADVNINMTTTVDFIPDNIVLGPSTTFDFSSAAPAAGGTTSIKRVTTTLTSTEPAFADKQIVLQSFSCNIGIAKSKTNGS